jgi:carboxyl-terminal processing protease
MTFLILVAISFGCSRKSEGLKQSDVEPLMNYFLSQHVTINNFTGEVSRRTLDNLVSTLDPWKMYFTKTDIDEIMKDKDNLADYVYADSSSSDYLFFLFNIYKVYNIRFNQRYSLFNELIKGGFDFTIDESIPADKDKVSFTDNEKEISERWRKTIKLQLLSYVNSGKSLDDAKKKVAKKYELTKKDIDTINRERIFKSFVNSFALALDPHSEYMDADEFDDFQIQMNLKLEGIGAVLRSEDGFVFVESIMPGGPASKLPDNAKLLPNDKIVAVAQGNSDPEDVIDIPLQQAVKKIRGKKGTTVRLSVIREAPDGKTKQMILPIIRDRIILDQQAAKSDVYELTTDGKSTKIGYIKLPAFYHDNTNDGDEQTKICSEDVLTELNKLKKNGVDAMVLDLRENGGGYLTDAVKIGGYFIKSGPIVQVKSHGQVRVESDQDSSIQYDGPLVILIDKLSASASEIVAGAMKDYKRAILIGSTTFGKGSVQNLIPLGGRNGAVKVTINLFYQPSGNSNHLNGVKPDITIGEMTDLLDFGESKLKYPLKWEPIDSSPFQQTPRFVNPSIVSSLTEKSRSRIKTDKDFITLGEKMEKFRKQLAEKTISLKKDTSGDLGDEVEKQLKEKESREKKDKLIDTQKDIFLREAFNITADYAQLLKKSQ